jgi:hypothetical protein
MHAAAVLVADLLPIVGWEMIAEKKIRWWLGLGKKSKPHVNAVGGVTSTVPIEGVREVDRGVKSTYSGRPKSHFCIYMEKACVLVPKLELGTDVCLRAYASLGSAFGVIPRLRVTCRESVAHYANPSEECDKSERLRCWRRCTEEARQLNRLRSQYTCRLAITNESRPQTYLRLAKGVIRGLCEFPMMHWG